MHRLLRPMRGHLARVPRSGSAGVAGRAPVPLIAAVSTVVILASTSAVVIATIGGEPAQATLATVPTRETLNRRATPRATTAPTPTPTPSPDAAAGGDGGPPIALANPGPGTGQWRYAEAGPTFGSGGGVLTYRVAVEVGLPISVGEFTALVDSALGDPRGWTGRGERRFRRVGGSAGANFTVYLASPWTAYSLCRAVVDIRIGGVPYTNCQAGAPVVINSDRYLNGASRFTGGLDVYRHYAVNHEVGHRLGRQHVNCPGTGQLAPVMQQQTLGLVGCRPNPWPYPGNPAPPTTRPPASTPPTTAPPTTAPPPTTEPPPTTPPPTTPPPTTASPSTETSTVGPSVL